MPVSFIHVFYTVYLTFFLSTESLRVKRTPMKPERKKEKEKKKVTMTVPQEASVIWRTNRVIVHKSELLNY